MKKLVLVLVLFSISFVSQGQWQINGSSIYYNQGNVGIGLSDPFYRFEIEGIEDYATDSRTFIRLINKSVSQNSGVSMKLYAGENGSCTSISHMAETYLASPNQADFGQLWTNGAGLLFRASHGIIRFETSSGNATIERMRIDTAGLIGIGTGEPKAKLHIADGDIYISDIKKGIIMKSPDGQCWKGTLNNEGVLNFIQMYCPGAVNQIGQSQDDDYNISISPIPANNYISIRFNEDDLKKLNFTLFDASGRTVLDGKIWSSGHKIDISRILNGIYILNLYDKSGKVITSKKIIKN